MGALPTPREHLERKPQSVCHLMRENLPGTLNQSLPGNSRRLCGNHLSPNRAAAGKSQPPQNALVTTTDSRGLPPRKCSLLLSTLITPARPLFWVNGCSPSHWQD